MGKRLIYLNTNDGSGILAFGGTNAYFHKQDAPFSAIQQFIDGNKGEFIFTLLSYDLKNQLEDLTSSNENSTDFPLAILWVPEVVVKIVNKEVKYAKGQETSETNQTISDFLAKQTHRSKKQTPIQLTARTSKESYLKNVASLLNEIQYGNIYEVNYCQEFYAREVELIDPVSTYFELNDITQAPFSVYVEFDDFHVFCGSPERYIKKKGDILLSQPIKGTIKRGANYLEDEELIERLKNDPKEIAENVMIVDLVRNDLSRVAKKNSVEVTELCGIYSFKTVHQMISTIQCTVESEVNWSEIIRATFPMGSMTGAPKISAMKIIDEHEDFSRGLYSGSIGYIEPNGNFDMNVVIRAVIHNAKTNYLSCAVGGAITIQSNPLNEYEECFTKVRPILTCLNGES